MREARDALGRRLRELRTAASMTGQAVAEALSWPHSKVSKLENARQTPTEDDIRAWTRATGHPEETEALLATLRTLEVRHAEWQRQLRGGLRPHQRKLAELDARTRLFRAFEPTFVPGLLQTGEYARYRFTQSVTVHRVHDDVDEAVAARLLRQEVLYRSDKRFHFVLTEAVLHYRLCPPEIMLGQLDRLLSLSTLPNVRLGVIGFEASYAVAPAHGFWILDEDRVMVETFSAELNLEQPQEIALYAGVFDALAGAASYGRAGRAVITRVAEQLATGLPD